MKADLLGYGDPSGYRPLREAIAAYLGPARGVRCTADNIVVLSGAQQAFGLVMHLLADPGDMVWVEDPGYAAARGAAVAAGVRVRPMPVDDEGVTLDTKAKPPRLVFVTPSHQFPLGITMSLARRLALLEWAGQCGTMIVEDDYGSEYRYTGRPLSALQGLAANDRVIYVGSFSKVLFPALRLGYAVVPSHLVDAFIATKGVLDGHAPLLEQATVGQFIAEGHFARHIARMRRLYRARHDALIAASRPRLDGLLDVRPTATGMHLIGWLPQHLDDRTVSKEAGGAGVEVAPLSQFRVRTAGPAGLVLGFASSSEAAIERAVECLASVLDRSRGGRPRGRRSVTAVRTTM